MGSPKRGILETSDLQDFLSLDRHDLFRAAIFVIISKKGGLVNRLSYNFSFNVFLAFVFESRTETYLCAKKLVQWAP